MSPDDKASRPLEASGLAQRQDQQRQQRQPAPAVPPVVEVPPPEPARRQLTRRELLRVGATTAAAAATVGLAAWLHERKAAGAPTGPSLAKIRDHRVVLPAGSNQMAIVRGPDAAANVRKAVEALGGIALFVKRGEKVLVKPNVGWNRLPEHAANTNPAVVAEVVRMVKAAGASEVWVADVPVNTADRCFERSGIRRAALEAGAKVVLPDKPNWRPVEVGGRVLRAAEVLYPFVEADRIINLPIVKQHSLCGATLSMKNWYGALGGHRVRLHQEIHKSVVDLAAMVKPTLTILDATRILTGNGPSGGSLDDVKQLDLIAAATDEVALDAWGITLLGVSREEAGFIAEGEAAGLGTADFKRLKLVQVDG